MKKTLIMLSVAGLTATGAHANGGIVGEAGTTGIGFHAELPLRPNVNARFGVGYLDYSTNRSTRDMNYDLSLKADLYDALLDWYPQENGSFRVTAGLAYNGSRINVQGRSNTAGNYTINGNTYNAASVGKVTGKVDFRKSAPYFGIGWSKSTGKGWSFATDIGMLFHGSPHTSLSSSGCTASAATCNQLVSDLEKENTALSREVSRFKVYPVLRVGIRYTF